MADKYIGVIECQTSIKHIKHIRQRARVVNGYDSNGHLLDIICLRARRVNMSFPSFAINY
jgi:hypothetical protein